MQPQPGAVMSTNETRPDLVGDQNVERLVGQAYRPELPDAEFARHLTARLCATAQELALERLRAAPPDDGALRRTRWKLAWSMAAAAAVAACALFVHALHKPVNLPGNIAIPTDAGPRPKPAQATRYVAPTRAVPAVAIGETLSTKEGERRRVALTDGSILYLNEKTKVQLDAERHVRLFAGQVF